MGLVRKRHEIPTLDSKPGQLRFEACEQRLGSREMESGDISLICLWAFHCDPRLWDDRDGDPLGLIECILAHALRRTVPVCLPAQLPDSVTGLFFHFGHGHGYGIWLWVGNSATVGRPLPVAVAAII